ncbi:hypothetical protein [Pseudomonas fragi]|uniref:Uncharacterized protein n=1 Tax=Pseudomonas fragi TaxID=296 RepID=A0A9Q6YFX9_PSEFR|nr:hypothetical protein [Pseudomonas fragi]NNB15839.1 hypothetical protein [Pseudomonas fragi]NNB18349.1 hypothetical protein [Pseudomonas fragi]NNB32153.1 hypothetical protein [Pseudomonas fragi]NNB54328.1 hypothetical protein [Pseudomonas fragi]QPL33548.1 hypothetical protein I5R27_10855 [Pseudomonas fragi]
MTKHYFLFTYSISPTGDTDIAAKAADKVRKSIANIQTPDWNKLSTVETTFAGQVTLTAETACEKREEARNIIDRELRSAIDLCKARCEVQAHISVLVDGLGPRMDIII